MFSREDANQLRESLPALDFNLEASASDLSARYQSHYNVDFVAQGMASHHSMGRFASSGFDLVCQYFTPSAEYQVAQRGTVFLLHGYLDHTGIYGHLIRHCLQLGLAVVIFDMPGHGLSSGKVASIKTFRFYVQALNDCLKIAHKQNLGQPWSLIGQSTGCAVIIEFLLDAEKYDRYNFKNILMMAPLLRPQGWFLSQLLLATAGRVKSHIKRRFAENSHDQEFLKFLRESDALQSQTLQTDWLKAMSKYYRRFDKKKNCDQPMHIIQGTDDDTVDWEYNLPRLEKRFPRATIHIIADARHHMVNETPEYREKIFAVVSEVLAGGSQG